MPLPFIMLTTKEFIIMHFMAMLFNNLVDEVFVNYIFLFLFLRSNVLLAPAVVVLWSSNSFVSVMLQIAIVGCVDFLHNGAYRFWGWSKFNINVLVKNP